MAAYEPTLGELARRLGDLERLDLSRQVQRLDDVHGDVADLKADMRAVRRALYTFGGSLLVSAVLFAVTVFASGFGHA